MYSLLELSIFPGHDILTAINEIPPEFSTPITMFVISLAINNQTTKGK